MTPKPRALCTAHLAAGQTAQQLWQPTALGEMTFTSGVWGIEFRVWDLGYSTWVRFWGLGYIEVLPLRTEDQMDKNMKNEMKTGIT